MTAPTHRSVADDAVDWWPSSEVERYSGYLRKPNTLWNAGTSAGLMNTVRALWFAEDDDERDAVLLEAALFEAVQRFDREECDPGVSATTHELQYSVVAFLRSRSFGTRHHRSRDALPGRLPYFGGLRMTSMHDVMSWCGLLAAVALGHWQLVHVIDITKRKPTLVAGGGTPADD